LDCTETESRNCEMCKSLNRELNDADSVPSLLMPRELHNWLLFRALDGSKECKVILNHRSLPRSILSPPAIPQAFPQKSFPVQVKASKVFTEHNYSNSCTAKDYSSGAKPPSTMVSNLVQFFRNARLIRPIGPLRCLPMMISALPCRSGSSCL